MIAADPRLELMAQIAQPLDEWCEFNCGRLAYVRTADGVAACEDCAKAVIEALQKYESEARDAADAAAKALLPTPLSARAAKARAKRRAKRKRTKR